MGGHPVVKSALGEETISHSTLTTEYQYIQYVTFVVVEATSCLG